VAANHAKGTNPIAFRRVICVIRRLQSFPPCPILPTLERIMHFALVGMARRAVLRCASSGRREWPWSPAMPSKDAGGAVSLP